MVKVEGTDQQWIVCQIGAREHYAIPRALCSNDSLSTLVTDFWVHPGSVIEKVPGAQRLRDRWHQDLAEASVQGFNLGMLAFELKNKLGRNNAWSQVMKRNSFFQNKALPILEKLSFDQASPVILFSYSYAALELFRFAKMIGWKTVLGQIDPGPEEQRIVETEHQRYSHLKSSWMSAPETYWQDWREETELADRIVVNSEWSRDCLVKEGVADDKLEVIPLIYSSDMRGESVKSTKKKGQALRVLFLGQINLRKGIGRLIDAMRLLEKESIELTMVGSTEIDSSVWADLPSVKWIGSVARSEVGKYYDCADLLILPTLSDGYALTQLEAISHGLPVMASKYCGSVVVDGENGWVLEDLEPLTIARKLREVCSAGIKTEPIDKSIGISETAGYLNSLFR